MKLILAPLLFIGGSLLAASEDDAKAGLEAAANAASAVIRPAAEGKRTVKLPSLDYELSIAAHCPAGQRPLSASASIADARKNIELTETDGHHSATIVLAVPASQLAPVVTENFCSLDDQQSRKTLEIAGVLTAQLSLRCGEEQAQSAYFLNLPLAVSLVCDDVDQVAP